MTLNAFTRHPKLAVVSGTSAAILVGLALWTSSFGARWENTSFDYLFRLATRPVTNQVVILFMDSNSLAQTGQNRTQAWDRARHVSLLNRLAEDHCPLVVFDVWFGEEGDPTTDLAMAKAMKRLSNVVLMAWPMEDVFQPEQARSGLYSFRSLPPSELFLDAVGQKNWGVGSALTNRDGVVRRHWPFTAPGLARAAAQVLGAHLSALPEERWMRYYEPGWAWTSLSYIEAEKREPDFFRDKIVFIGNKPEDDLPNGEADEFSTPFTRRTSGAVSGVEILATEFLNLVNGEWMLRPPRWIEISILILIGGALGYALSRAGRVLACLLALIAVFIIVVVAMYLSLHTNYWFPWLIIAGGQVPVALAFALIWPARSSTLKTTVDRESTPGSTPLPLPAIDGAIDLPDYELAQPPIGEGAYGKVWLARNAVGQWQALKIVYRAKFGEDQSPYEREFRGIESYKRVSDAHAGLLRVDFVSRMKPQGYFYYAMELGDAVTPGWELNPANYRPLDLAALCSANHRRLPARECARIGAQLCDALHFLHSQGLAHRDIKPRNIIFVNGQPKLADVGLVADVQRPLQDITWVGTPGYMPPPPEPPGTPAADIYGLGMVLYVISTGCKPSVFPALSETLVDGKLHPDFNLLSPVIFHACHPDRMKRPTAIEMKEALLQVEMKLKANSTPAPEPFKDPV